MGQDGNPSEKPLGKFFYLWGVAPNPTRDFFKKGPLTPKISRNGEAKMHEICRNKVGFQNFVRLDAGAS